MVNLRNEARGRGCQVRLEGVCNHNSETVVLAHFRLIGISGLGYKSREGDLIASWCCSACHEVVDRDKSDAVQLDFAKGVLRTQMQLIREDQIKW